jgi:DME family drug/metabolite transporter
MMRQPGRETLVMTHHHQRGVDGLTGCALVLGAGILWGTVGTARAFAPADIPPQIIGVLRLSIAGAVLMTLAALRGDLNGMRRFFGGAVLCGSMGMAAYQIFFFAAIAETGVAAGTIVAMGSPPVFAGLIEWGLHGERPNAQWTGATVLAISGCSLLILSGGGLSIDATGVLLAVGAGAAFAVFSTAGRRLVARVPAYAAIAVVSSSAALLLAPFLWTADLDWLARPSGYAVILFLAIFATACPYLLYTLGLKRVNAKTATTLSLAEPLTAALLGVLVLGERFSAIAVMGMALLLAGFALTSIEAGRTRSVKPEMHRLEANLSD